MPDRMPGLADFASFAARDHGLVVVTTVRADGTPQSTVVNAGVMPHPATGQDVVAFVARGGTRKLANLRERPRAAVAARSGWEWVTVEGDAGLVGPDDPADGVDVEALRLLLRAVFAAAGGTHDDWDAFDAVMAAERRTAVLVPPAKVYGVLR